MPQQITIPVPCHEDWNAMTENDRGRHCAQCEKTVVDFTNKQPQEILFYLNENKSAKVCGRFTAEQLEEPIPTPEDFVKQISYFRMPMMRKIAAIFLFAFSVMAVSCNDSQDTLGKLQIAQAVIDTPPHITGDTIVMRPTMGAVMQLPADTPKKLRPICRPVSNTHLKGDIAVIDTPPPAQGFEVGEIAVVDTPVQVPKPVIMGKIAMPRKNN